MLRPALPVGSFELFLRLGIPWAGGSCDPLPRRQTAMEPVPVPTRLSVLTALEREAVERYARRLTEVLGPGLSSAIVFGSRARGEGHGGSDLDVAVVVRVRESEVVRAASDLATAVNMDYDYGVRIAPLVLSAETLEVLRRRERALARAILDEGIPL